MKAFFKNEDGEVLVLVVLFLTIFVAFLALVIDAGSIYLEKSRLQKIADAAVLAGVQDFPTNYDKTKSEITKTIQMNEGDPANFTISTNSAYTMLQVAGSQKATFYFAKALGFQEPVVQVKARVDLYPLSVGSGAVPLTVQSSVNFSYGSLQTLMVSDSTSGSFGAIDLSGSGASNFEMDLTNGYQRDLQVGTLLDIESGKMSGPTERGVNYRISQCPNATFNNFPPNCERVVLVPIIQSIPGNNKHVRVVGFATFFLEQVTASSTNALVTGRFIRKTYIGESSSSQANFGTYSYKKTQ
ncbi:pilus assembly protein TadG-related protein [Schinkia sp. CFF1]